MAARFRLALLALTCLPALGQAREYQLTVGAAQTEVLGDGYTVATGRSSAVTPDFGFAVEVGRGALVGLRVGGVSSIGDGGLFGSESDVSTLDLALTGRWQYPALRWLVPFVDVAVGTSRVKYETAGEDLVTWTALVGADLGVGFRTTPGMLVGTLVLGVDLSVGYTWRSSAELEAGGVPLGTLDVHGTVARLGVLAAF